MVNYRENRERFKPDKLGSLYVNKAAFKSLKRPTIYIGGQMEHRCHILEQSGFTFDEAHGMFDGSWFYDYPVKSVDKDSINAVNFSNNLVKALEMANLESVDLITESYGGIIGAYATKSERVHSVIALHPPILGTPLADLEQYEKYYPFLPKKEKLLWKIIKKVVDSRYGFEQENSGKINFSKVYLNKLLVVGSSIKNSEETEMVKELNCLIEALTGYSSDGVVIFDHDLLKKIGVNHVIDEEATNHFEAGSREYIEKTLRLIHR